MEGGGLVRRHRFSRGISRAELIMDFTSPKVFARCGIKTTAMFGGEGEGIRRKRFAVILCAL